MSQGLRVYVMGQHLPAVSKCRCDMHRSVWMHLSMGFLLFYITTVNSASLFRV